MYSVWYIRLTWSCVQLDARIYWCQQHKNHVWLPVAAAGILAPKPNTICILSYATTFALSCLFYQDKQLEHVVQCTMLMYDSDGSWSLTMEEFSHLMNHSDLLSKFTFHI